MIEGEEAIREAVDGLTHADEPAAARAFVGWLPTAERTAPGIPVTLCSDEAVRALANAALIDAGGDLIATHEVIAHLPETADGVRNRLITGFYAELARRAEAIFAGSLAEQPWRSGHPGANWLWLAPWASDQVGEVIRGDWSAFGVHPALPQRQAAADGNQVIFGDVGARFAAFVALYERHPRPSTKQVEAFFAATFHDGDAQIRDGFAAYIGVVEEIDPQRRQELMLQGNTLVATYEQALVQTHLEELFAGLWPDTVPDELVVRYVDIVADPLEVDVAVVRGTWPNNLLDPTTVLDLDPAGQNPADYGAHGPAPSRITPIRSVPSRVPESATRLGTEPMEPAVVRVADIGGIEAWDDTFPTSIAVWKQRASGGALGPNAWIDPHERMWFILKLFEQNLTNPRLYETDDRGLGLDAIAWLTPATGWR